MNVGDDRIIFDVQLNNFRYVSKLNQKANLELLKHKHRITEKLLDEIKERIAKKLDNQQDYVNILFGLTMQGLHKVLIIH